MSYVTYLRGDYMRPGFDTKPVTIRVPATIRAELDKRVREGFGQTDVILEALCQAWGIIDPRKKKPQEQAPR